MSSASPDQPKRSAAAVPLSLRLYVAGRLPHSLEAVANLRRLCAGSGALPPSVEIVDVLREPERALADGIVATSTLVRLAPEPALRILGTLSDLERVRTALGIVDPIQP